MSDIEITEVIRVIERQVSDDFKYRLPFFVKGVQDFVINIVQILNDSVWSGLK